MKRWLIIGAALMAALSVLLWWGARDTPDEDEAASLGVTHMAGVLGAEAPGFARAIAPRTFCFPQDHGAHPEFRTEWWYFTGNLETSSQRRFGYELTLFRIALTPTPAPRTSRWATHQLYLGHFALTDIANQRFHAVERLSRAALGLAGATQNPLRVWVEDWSIAFTGEHWMLQASTDEVAIELTLDPVKPIVLQGEQGLSQKGEEPGNASYYYSIPRLATHGTVTASGETVEVEGLSWMDREWSTSALSKAQTGWDWFALHLSNGADLMAYQIRRQDGTLDPHSQGVLIGPIPDGSNTPSARSPLAGPPSAGLSSAGPVSGAMPGVGGTADCDPYRNEAVPVIPLSAQDLELTVTDHWQSPRGGRYPARWRLTVKPLDLALEIIPVLADQELDTFVRYWEGAVEVKGETISGRGYAELTGYAARP